MSTKCYNELIIFHKDSLIIDQIETKFNISKDLHYAIYGDSPLNEHILIDKSCKCFRNNNYLTFNYYSSWCPTDALFISLYLSNFTVIAYYNGDDYCGFYENGKDNYYEYDIADIKTLEVLPKDLLEWTDLIEKHYKYMRGDL